MIYKAPQKTKDRAARTPLKTGVNSGVKCWYNGGYL